MKQKEIYCEKELGKRHGPYVQGLRYNDLIFTTQIATLSNGEMLDGDAYEQTIQTLKNTEAILKAEGSSLANILKCTIYVLDYDNDFDQVNQAYKELMISEPLPARACVQVCKMAAGAKVEMEIVAYAE